PYFEGFRAGTLDLDHDAELHCDVTFFLLPCPIARRAASIAKRRSFFVFSCRIKVSAPAFGFGDCHALLNWLSRAVRSCSSRELLIRYSKSWPLCGSFWVTSYVPLGALVRSFRLGLNWTNCPTWNLCMRYHRACDVLIWENDGGGVDGAG